MPWNFPSVEGTTGFHGTATRATSFLNVTPKASGSLSTYSTDSVSGYSEGQADSHGRGGQQLQRTSRAGSDNLDSLARATGALIVTRRPQSEQLVSVVFPSPPRTASSGGSPTAGMWTQPAAMPASSSSASSEAIVTRPAPSLSGLPPLPPTHIVHKLMDNYFTWADPVRPVLHKAQFANRPVPPIVLTTMCLLSLSTDLAVPELNHEDRLLWQISLFERAKVELLYSMSVVPTADFPEIFALIVSILFLMMWADGNGLYAMDRGLQRLCGRVLTTVLFVKHRAATCRSWDSIMCSLLKIREPALAVHENLDALQRSILREGWIDYWQLQLALWVFAMHMSNVRCRRREEWELVDRDIFEAVVSHLYSLPFENVWKGSQCKTFDPRFVSSPSRKMGPLVDWVDWPQGPMRNKMIGALPEALTNTRGLLPMIQAKLRIRTNSFLAACRRLGLQSPAQLTELAKERNANPEYAALLETRNSIEATVAACWNSVPEGVRYGWNIRDAHVAATSLSETLESWNCAYESIAQSPGLLAIRIEVRTGIGIFLVDPERKDLDSVDLTDEYQAGGQHDALVPAVISGVLFMESLYPRLHRLGVLALVPTLLSVSMFLVCAYRRIRQDVLTDTSLHAAFQLVCDTLGICLSLLHRFSGMNPGSFAESVYTLIKKLLEEGRVTLAEMDAAAAKVDAVDQTDFGIQAHTKGLTELLAGI